MNKTTRTLLIVAASLVLAGGLMLGVAWAMGTGPAQLGQISLPWRSGSLGGINVGTFFPDYRDWDSAYSEDGGYSVSASGIDGLDIGWIAGGAEVKVYGGEDIQFNESAGGRIEEEDALRWGVEGGTLYIQYCRPHTDGNLPLKDLEVLLPASLAEELSDFSFDGTSAALTVSGLTAGNFSFSGVSGALSAEDMDADSVELDTVSGELSFGGVFAELNADGTSGGIHVSGGSGAARVSADTVSGEVALGGSFDDVRVNTTSGGVSVNADACPNSLKIDTVSGGVGLTLPSGSGFTLDYDTVSGSLKCAFPVTMDDGEYICGDGAAAFEVNTTSGGLDVSDAG